METTIHHLPPNFTGLYGQVRAALCPRLGVFDALPGTRVLLAPASLGLDPENVWDDRDPLPSVDAILPAILHQLEEPLDFDALVDCGEGLVTAETGDEGLFVVPEWGVEEAVDAFVEVRQQPTPNLEERFEPLTTATTLYLGRYQPTATTFGHRLELVIPRKVWCRIQLANDHWTLVGRVVSSTTRNPLEGLRVTAHDVDFIQDDRLGQAWTDSRGIFRLDYPGAAFRRRPLGGPREGTSGPDLYFQVHDADDNEVLREPRAAGRRSGRENSGPCACVELEVPLDDARPRESIGWNRIGGIDLPAGRDLNDFDAEGYALVNSQHYALHSVLWLDGEVFRRPFRDGGFVDLLGRPLRYRFLAMEAPAGTRNSTQGQLPEAAFAQAKVVGVGPGASLFAPIQVGTLKSYDEQKTIEVRLERQDLEAEGWVDLNQVVARVLQDPSHWLPGERRRPREEFTFKFEHGLMALDTRSLTTNPTPPAVVAGQEVAPKPFKVQTFALRYELRSFDVANPRSDGTIPSFEMPGHGKQLDAVVVCNDPLLAAVDVVEHQQTTKCQPLSGKVELAYTAYHPHLGTVDLTVHSTDNAYSVALQDGSNLPLRNPNQPSLDQVHHAGLQLPPTDPDGTPLKRCTYKVNLRITRRLHNGWSAYPAQHRDTEFFWSPTPIP